MILIFSTTITERIKEKKKLKYPIFIVEKNGENFKNIKILTNTGKIVKDFKTKKFKFKISSQ
ncbi:hypothetical protein BBU29805_0289 [Borreliella burgdorferi 29805]|nr:hypothetical protein BBU29805_0289 [Borreliella burgdorferi 29805]